MKKRLEADLISIAHKILQLKNKSDVNQLFLETQKLYEKLSVLRFVEEHFGEAKPTIGQAEIVEKMRQFFEDNHLSEIKTRKTPDEIVVEETTAEEIVVDEIAGTAEEEVADIELEEVHEETVPEEEIVSEEKVEVPEEELPEKIVLEEEIVSEEKEEVSDEELAEEVVLKEEELADEVTEEEVSEEEIEEVAETELEEITTREPIESKETGFQPDFQLDKEEEVLNNMKEDQVSFFDLLAGDYRDTFFEKVEQIENESPKIAVEIPKIIDLEEKATESIAEAKKENEEHKAVSLNDKLAKGINIDLNDRIAFVKHLFGNSNEDYNRVLSQLITFNSFYETRNFIEEMVKPDYNNWEGKDNYAERFMEIIEKKFL